jgi:hypothetical protein
MLWFCILITSGLGCFKNKGKHLEMLSCLKSEGGCPKYFAGFRTMGSGVRVSFSVLKLDRQTEAIGMYQKCGYTVIDNEPYLGLKNSTCGNKFKE